MANELFSFLGRLFLVFLGSILLGAVILGLALPLLMILPTPTKSVGQELQELHEAAIQLKKALREAIISSRLGRFLKRFIGGERR